MDYWDQFMETLPERIEKLPARWQRAAWWIADFPPFTWIASFSPVNFVFEVLDRATRARAGTYAAQIAFYLLMSAFPMMILMLQLLRAAPISQESLLMVIDQVFPSYLVTTLHSILQEVFSTTFGLVPITIVSMLWSSSKIMHTMIAGLDLICDRDKSRNWFAVRAWSLLCTLLLAVVIIAVAGSTVVWQPLRETLLRHRPHGVSLSMYTTVTRMVYTFLVGTFALAVLYKILPRRRLRFVVQLPGAFVAVLAVYVFTAGVGIYVSRFNGFSAYGSLTTLTLVMFWMYFSCYFVMLGAVINEAMHGRRVVRKQKAAQRAAEREAKAAAREALVAKLAAREAAGSKARAFESVMEERATVASANAQAAGAQAVERAALGNDAGAPDATAVSADAGSSEDAAREARIAKARAVEARLREKRNANN